jgi:hypothetical protein
MKNKKGKKGIEATRHKEKSQKQIEGRLNRGFHVFAFSFRLSAFAFRLSAVFACSVKRVACSGIDH